MFPLEQRPSRRMPNTSFKKVSLAVINRQKRLQGAGNADKPLCRKELIKKA